MRKSITVILASFFVVTVPLPFFIQNSFAANENVVFSLAALQKPTDDLKLTQEDIAALTKPAVVRVVYHVTGDVTVPAFTINYKNGLTATIVKTAKPYKTTIDEYLSGSGFIVSPDGYIITNAHVVSEATIKNVVVASLMVGTIFADTQRGVISEADAKKFEDNEEGVQKDGLAMANYLKANSTFNLKSERVVINPSSADSKILDAFRSGFQATIVSVNDKYNEDERDVALIKIDQDNLPSITPGDSGSLTTGNKVYVFGFPSKATINLKDFLESSFTQGVVNAIKDSKDGTFKIFQSDTKVSQGSSGGPLFDERGRAVGIVTFQSGSSLASGGDNFAFAIPIDIAKKVLSEKSIPFGESDYATNFRNGFSLLQNKHCKKAIEEFDKVGKTNPNFLALKFVQPYKDKCDAMIKSGESIDGPVAEFVAFLKSLPAVIWAGIGVGLVLIVVVFWLWKRTKREEKEIELLEGAMSSRGNEATVTRQPTQVSTTQNSMPATTPATPNGVSQAQQPVTWQTPAVQQEKKYDSSVIQFVQNEKKSGSSHYKIATSLRQAGWSEDDVQNLLKY